MSKSESRNGITFSGVMQSVGLLVLRVGVGFAMLRGHGIGKVTELFSEPWSFPDPLGLGSEVSLGLVVFAEVICAVLLMLGLFTRIAAIPLVIDMLVAFLLFHAGEDWIQREPSFLFLIPFLTLMITGPGWYSLDNIRKRMKRNRKKKALASSGSSVATAGLPGAPFAHGTPPVGVGSGLPVDDVPKTP